MHSVHFAIDCCTGSFNTLSMVPLWVSAAKRHRNLPKDHFLAVGSSLLSIISPGTQEERSMSLLSCLQVTRTPFRVVVANAKHLNIKASVYAVRKNLEPLPWKGHLRNEKARNVLRDVETVTVSQVKHAWAYVQAVNFTSIFNTVPKQDGDTEVFKTGPIGYWIQNIYQKERLLDGLFGSPRFKQSLGPWSPCCSGLHLVPARYYCVPTDFTPPRVPADPLGITYSMDLGPDDQIKLQQIAYGKLKKILKSNKISYKKRSKKNEQPPAGELFGSSLDTEAAKDISAERITREFQVPILLRLMLEFINEKGMETETIFRRPGDPESVGSFMRLAFKRKDNAAFKIPPQTPVYDVATTVMGYIGRMQVPLMGTEKIIVYPDLQKLDFAKYQISALNYFILSMTQPHKDTLHLLATTLFNVQKNRATTKVNIDYLSTIFGEIIFRLHDKATPVELALRKVDWIYLTKVMIHYRKRLFLVEPELMLELRSKFKGKSGFPWKLGQKKKDKREGDASASAPEPNKMKVSAPSLPRTELTLKFEADTLAEDIIHTYTEICKKDGEIPSSKWQYCLFEIGGNIGERCLHNKAPVLRVHLANPTAEFVIKEKYGRVAAANETSGGSSAASGRS